MSKNLELYENKTFIEYLVNTNENIPDYDIGDTFYIVKLFDSIYYSKFIPNENGNCIHEITKEKGKIINEHEYLYQIIPVVIQGKVKQLLNHNYWKYYIWDSFNEEAIEFDIIKTFNSLNGCFEEISIHIKDCDITNYKIIDENNKEIKL